MPRVRTLIVLFALGAAPGCVNRPAALTEWLEARRLASELHVEFTKASDASNLAVMADTDEASSAAADQARRARQVVERDAETLRALVVSLGYLQDARDLEEFNTTYGEYRRLDDEILSLAVENTNLKAQRLSFGPARESADAFRAAVEAAARSAAARDRCRVDAIGNNARIAVLEILALQAPHIAEPEDATMTQIEGQMATAEAAARAALAELARELPADSSEVAKAMAALDRFGSVNSEILKLSRRNSNVRSLTLALGRKRTLTAQCDDQLAAFEQALAKHEVTATR
jgi:hypothetical protein